MKEAAASRVAADLCWFFMLFCLFSPVMPALGMLGLFTAVCLLLGFLALRPEQAALRLLCALPALALCALAPDTSTRLALGLGWLYFALTFALGRFQMEYWVYRRAFSYMGALALLVTLYVSAAKTLEVRVPGGVSAFAAVFVLLGLYTLRAIRMGVSTDFGWKAYSALELAIPAAAGGVLFALLRFVFQHAGTVFTILFSPFALLLRLATDLLSLLSSGPDMGPLGGTVTDAAPPEIFDPPPAETGAPGLPADEVILPEPPSIPWGAILAVLAILIALLLLVLYLRQGKRAADAPMERVAEERFRVFRRRTRRPPPQNYAGRVRRCYETYLRCLEINGQSIGLGDTSLDILTAPDRPLRSPDEEELRRIYLIARYGDADSLSAADAEAAERCLDAIRSLKTPDGAEMA